MSFVEKLNCPHCVKREGFDKQVKKLSQLWSFIPKVICINLIDRPDRKKHAILEFHRVGLCQKVEFLITERPRAEQLSSENDNKQIGTMGCWKSHSEAAGIIFYENLKFGLIFEDDVLFDEDLLKIERGLKTLKEFILTGEHVWDIIYLGCWSFWIKPTKFIHSRGESVVQKCHARCFHGYCLSKNFAKKITQESWENQQHEKPLIFKNVPNFGIDSWSAYKSKNAYCLFPLIATQAPITSSNDRAINKKLIDLALSNPKFMKMNQYASMLGSIFVHILMMFLSSHYRKSVMA